MTAISPDPSSSAFGGWDTELGLPVFHHRARPDDRRCRWDPLVEPITSRHVHAFGNRRFQVHASSDGDVALWDTASGYRWLTAADPGTGHTTLADVAGDDHRDAPGDVPASWGSCRELWPADAVPTRTFGPTWYSVAITHDGIDLRRTVLCPDGDDPWIIVRVDVRADRDRQLRVDERWDLSPRFVARHTSPAEQRDIAAAAIAFDVVTDARGATLTERRRDEAAWSHLVPDRTGVAVFGDPAILRVAARHPIGHVHVDRSPHPVVTLRHECHLIADVQQTLWYVVGLVEGHTEPLDPEAAWMRSLDDLTGRVPSAACSQVPALEREVPWHAAVLTGGACVDRVLGGHTLDQGSAYTFRLGFNGAARDPLQHALPLVYIEPDLALSVLRNTCSWADPAGELPYALDGAKQPLMGWYDPSDQALWSLWLAAEYAAATGDLDAFAEPVGFHPTHDADAAPLAEHLRRQFRHLVDVVGFGEHGHLRLQNADWNDTALLLSGIDERAMHDHGESVLNSAMAAWVLPRYAGLARRLGQADVANEADRLADTLRSLVASEWNGRWFRRAYGPGAVVGDTDLWLEVQPWAILCGAADEARSRELLATIDDVLRTGSPLGARVRGPAPLAVPPGWSDGEATAGGVWYSINMTLAWAAAGIEPALAWDELQRMTLARHTATYPAIWEGTLSGPDSYNSPESPRPGRTWGFGSEVTAMQAYPITNLHAHAQVLLTYLRVLGVEPAPDGALRVGRGGGRFHSAVLELDDEGHGLVRAIGAVRVETPSATLTSAGGTLEF